MADLLRRTTERVRAAFADWPDGSHDCEGWLDHDGADTSKRVRIHVRATKAGDRLSRDFSGSDAQTAGPVNTPGATARAVSMQAVLAASDPTIRSRGRPTSYCGTCATGMYRPRRPSATTAS